MKPVSRQQLIELLDKLDDTNKDVEKYKDFDLKKIEEVADRFIDKKSEFLAGVSGGVVGLTGGIAIAKTVADVAIFLSGPAGAVLGIALGMLIFRGRGQHKLERATRKYQLSKAIIEEAIRTLPADAQLKQRPNFGKLTTTYLKSIQK